MNNSIQNIKTGNALIIGGSSGIGLAMAVELIKQGKDCVYIAAKNPPDCGIISENLKKEFIKHTRFIKIDVCDEDYHVFDDINDIDTLIISCGFGRICPFEELSFIEIDKLIKCNELAIIQILRQYINKIKSSQDFYCAVMVSISGHLVSPLYSVYSAAKSGVARFIESLNAELAAENYANRILDCSPGRTDGTSFYGGRTKLSEISELAKNILNKIQARDTLYIPEYEKTYHSVLENYRDHPIEFALSSYAYKIRDSRSKGEFNLQIGFLSGTFDLFHIGHLNLLRRAKQQCDYLMVSVHASAAWKGKETFIPYEERKEILSSIRYVDEVVEDFAEDTDAWEKYHFDLLFVGSDYYGSDRFSRYEEFFKDKGVKIVYFPYTKGTSSTELREVLSLHLKNN